MNSQQNWKAARLDSIIEEVRARLLLICAQMPKLLFDEMVHRIAAVQLAFEFGRGDEPLPPASPTTPSRE